MDQKDALLQKIKKNIEEYCINYHNTSFDRHAPIIRLHEPTTSADEIYAAISTMLST